MSVRIETKRLRDLVRLYDGLRFLHEELFNVIETKIASMRLADVAAIQSAAEAEQAVVARMREREGLRLQMMEAIGRDLGLTAKESRSMTVSQLSARLAKPEGKLLAAAASKLQIALARTKQANRLASSIARDVVEHMKSVFASVRPREAAFVGYTGRGRNVAGAESSLFEAVG